MTVSGVRIKQWAPALKKKTLAFQGVRIKKGFMWERAASKPSFQKEAATLKKRPTLHQHIQQRQERTRTNTRLQQHYVLGAFKNSPATQLPGHPPPSISTSSASHFRGTQMQSDMRLDKDLTRHEIRPSGSRGGEPLSWEPPPRLDRMQRASYREKAVFLLFSSFHSSGAGERTSAKSARKSVWIGGQNCDLNRGRGEEKGKEASGRKFIKTISDIYDAVLTKTKRLDSYAENVDRNSNRKEEEFRSFSINLSRFLCRI